MYIYSAIMFISAIVFIALCISIYKGNTDLIHDYHQTKVVDKSAYGKAFSKALFIIATALLLSGIIGLFGSSDAIAMTSTAVLFIGLAIGIGSIIAVQKKYNNGLF